GEAVELAPPEREDIEIGARRAHALEAEIIGAGVERAETAEPHQPAGARRIEMTQLRDQPRRLGIIVWIFPRETAEDVPGHLDAELLAPAQQLDVLQAGAALLHQFEHAVGEAFDAGLDLRQAARAHLL